MKEKWKDKYISAFKTWEENWDVSCPFFQFSGPLRKIMYTTNTIESLNRQFRKYTKTKSVFPSDMSLLKCLYLSAKNITKKWTAPLKIAGILLTRYSPRSVLSGEVAELAEQLSNKLGTKLFKTTIREAIAVKEAQINQQSLFEYAPKAKVAGDYIDFIEKFLDCPLSNTIGIKNNSKSFLSRHLDAKTR